MHIQYETQGSHRPTHCPNGIPFRVASTKCLNCINFVKNHRSKRVLECSYGEIEWENINIETMSLDFFDQKNKFEFEMFVDNKWGACTLGWLVDNKNLKFRYRKIVVPSPTHKEIMTKWWKRPHKDVWFQVTGYNSATETYLCIGIYDRDLTVGHFKTIDFVDFESAGIPPECIKGETN